MPIIYETDEDKYYDKEDIKKYKKVLNLVLNLEEVESSYQEQRLDQDSTYPQEKVMMEMD